MNYKAILKDGSVVEDGKSLKYLLSNPTSISFFELTDSNNKFLVDCLNKFIIKNEEIVLRGNEDDNLFFTKRHYWTIGNKIKNHRFYYCLGFIKDYFLISADGEIIKRIK
jgi:hypothetical protein